MADNWGDYLFGSEDQRGQARERQRVAYEKARQSPDYQQLRRYAHRGEQLGEWGELDPRAAMMYLAADGLSPPAVTPGVYQDAWTAADYAWNAGARPRDTMFRAIQEAAKGNFEGSASLAGDAVVSPVVPSMASGTEGQEDDWRQYVSPGMGMFLDVATDPTTYMTIGARPLARAGYRGLRGLLNAADTARYGKGIPAYLETASGQMIRRLPNGDPAERIRRLLTSGAPR